MPTRFSAGHRPRRSDWLRFFTESGDPDIIFHHVPHTLFFQFAVNALAGLLALRANAGSGSGRA